MNGLNSIFRQKGTFAIEFSIVGLLLGVLLAFAQDAIIKISMKGKLDRLSYSAVSIIKERTQLYSGDTLASAPGSDDSFDLNNPMSGEHVTNIYTVVENSMKRITGSFDEAKFGMRLEEQTYTDNTPNTLVVYNSGTLVCSVGQTLADIEADLRITTTLERHPPIYRITLCYDTDNLVADLLSSGFERVSSTSVAVGR
ncbi:ATP-binding protein [Vibrio albus]|uniref:ATP-binding protein n=1 Tax=Vibrio albus TaxID=2200953 RepID=A0A2U3BEM6_9VIBR|nr:tight adherence pilus pseudopilin TadF [Vibrio albus]PWI35230.1 ATP-binding protein [Vibrio albus]